MSASLTSSRCCTWLPPSCSSWRCVVCPVAGDVPPAAISFGMIGMAIAVPCATLAAAWHGAAGGYAADHASASPSAARCRAVIAGATHSDDGAATTRRRIPLTGRPGGGVRRRCRVERSGGVPHRRARHHIHAQSLVEMSLGLAIGARSPSPARLIAFAKLQALMKGDADSVCRLSALAEPRPWAFCCCC